MTPFCWSSTAAAGAASRPASPCCAAKPTMTSPCRCRRHWQRWTTFRLWRRQVEWWSETSSPGTKNSGFMFSHHRLFPWCIFYASSSELLGLPDKDLFKIINTVGFTSQREVIIFTKKWINLSLQLILTWTSSRLIGVAGFAGLEEPEFSAWVVEVGSSRRGSPSSTLWSWNFEGVKLVLSTLSGPPPPYLPNNLISIQRV